ncbi:hypothetical protein GCM10010381_60910 [Streptomyces xantholiticus]|nr:hypothetical protein GCM10010381_60910 [Streptomyces xantholiticus]
MFCPAPGSVVGCLTGHPVVSMAGYDFADGGDVTAAAQAAADMVLLAPRLRHAREA